MKPAFVITLGLLTAVAALTVDLSLPAIPAMVHALGTTLPKGQQIVGVFMAGMALGQIPAGLLSDRMGRLPIMYVGMAIFTLAAIVAAAANNIELILAARFVQGFGAASAIVLSRAIVRDHSARSGEDRLRRAIVALELDHHRIGIVLLEVEDVADVGATPSID